MMRNDEPDIAAVAAAIGERARAAMLAALMAGEPLRAGVLAKRAGVAPATASGHLARLVDAGLVSCRRSGRNRYYELAGADVADAIEALARIASPASGRGTNGMAALRFARTCYDHLAGELGVLVTETLLERKLISAGCHEVTQRGSAWLSDLGIRVDELRRQRRAFARPCLDWTERRNHLAGSVGAALAAAMLERRWLVRLDGTRALRLTVRGRDGLYRALGLEIRGAAGGGVARVDPPG